MAHAPAGEARGLRLGDRRNAFGAGLSRTGIFPCREPLEGSRGIRPGIPASHRCRKAGGEPRARENEPRMGTPRQFRAVGENDGGCSGGYVTGKELTWHDTRIGSGRDTPAATFPYGTRINRDFFHE